MKTNKIIKHVVSLTSTAGHAILFLMVFGSVCFGQAANIRRQIFNDGWRFQRNDPAGTEGVLTWDKIKDWVAATGNEYVRDGAKPARPSGNLGDGVAYTSPSFDDSKWRSLDLPHDWGIEGEFQQELPGDTGKRPWAGIGWYRKHFKVTESDKDKQIFIDFDGAMSHSVVWLNGKFVGGWPYGYASFRLDLTPYLEYGKENVIAVRLDNPAESSRWYPGSGIYRNVWLVKTATLHVGGNGTYITTPDATKDSANVNIRVKVDNELAVPVHVDVKTAVYRAINGSRTGVPVATSSSSGVDVPGRGSNESASTMKVARPDFWSPSSPKLYVAVTQIVQNGKVVDTYETTFGIRTVKFDPDKGLLVNGEHVYVKGVCDHHDLGALGSAINVRALERQIEILKSFGVNAIRTSHNPPAPELLDLADKMGILILDEAFDAWTGAKRKNDYSTLFKDWHEKDMRSFIRRDRNHPSVIAWSIGNEIREQRPEGHPVAEMLRKIVHEEDPTRLVTAAANGGNSSTNGFQKTVDLFGFNYKPQLYAKFHADNPSQPVWATETASTVSSRGEYFFPVSEDKAKGFFDFQVSSYDLYAPPWATPPDSEFAGQDKAPATAGEFVWTGFDYLGEPTPYDADSKTLLNFTDPAKQAAAANTIKAGNKITVPSRSSYFGIVDLCGFPKDRFYIYQARWRPDLPMAHILPDWNWPDRIGQVTPVHVYTSGDEAELFLNGKSLGRKKRGAFEYRVRWDDVVYQPGELHVVAYKNGRKWAEDTVKTTEAASQLALAADHSNIAADGSDLSFITVKIADKSGLMVPRSNNRIKYEISGPGEIVAVDNGNAIEQESFQSTNRRAYNGMALVIVRSIKGKPGRIVLRASSDGLKGTSVAVLSHR